MAQIKSNIFFLYCFVVLAAGRISQAVDYTVTNTAASTRFTTEIGVDYSKKTMASATNFILDFFYDGKPPDNKHVKRVDMFLDDKAKNGAIAVTNNDVIHVSASYIQAYSGDVKTQITGVLYHEMTHIWQWNGNGQAPGGLIEGIADYIMRKAGYPPNEGVKPGQGDRWDQGYDVTARFLDYCDGLSEGFVKELNKKMRNSYSDKYFVDLLGKNVQQLWTDYKARNSN